MEKSRPLPRDDRRAAFWPGRGTDSASSSPPPLPRGRGGGLFFAIAERNGGGRSRYLQPPVPNPPPPPPFLSPPSLELSPLGGEKKEGKEGGFYQPYSGDGGDGVFGQGDSE